MLKQALLAALAVVSFAASSASAQSDLHPAPAACALEFKVTSTNLLFFSGGSGSGLITCRSIEGIVVSQAPVNITIEGIGLGLGRFAYRGLVANLGVLDPRDVAGKYAVIDANAAFVLAAGANFGLKGQETGLSLAGSVQAGMGLGVGAYGKIWTITLAQEPTFFF